ncbi:MAG: C25 family cysteine peptidase [Acidobacteriota bacterium]
MKKLLAVLSFCVICAAGGIGAPGDFWSLFYGDEGFRYKFISPTPSLESSAEYTKIKIESFGLTGDEGYPQVPVKIFKAAIPENAAVSLKIVNSRVEELKDLRIQPVPHHSLKRRPEDAIEKIQSGIESPEPDTVYRENVEAYASISPYPLTPVSLGNTGYIRNQKYIEIIFYPVLYYPAERKALLFSEVEVDIAFEYLGETTTDTSLTYTVEPAFERIYRDSFINYEQGKSFRIEGRQKESGSSFFPSSDQMAGWSATQSQTTSSIYKLKISKDGIYHLTYSYIQTNASGLLGQDPRTFKLMNRGVEVPIYVAGQDDGVFDTLDYIEFYGQALADEAKTLLNYDYSDPNPDIYQDNDFTDTNVYFLSAEGPAVDRKRVTTFDGNPVSGYPAPDDFYDTVHVEVIESDGTNNDTYLPLGGNDPWYWGPRIQSSGSPNYQDADIGIPGLSPFSHTAELRVRLRGTTSYSPNPDHTTIVGVISGGSYITDTKDTQSWDGESIFTHVKSFNQSYLSSTTKVRVEATTVAGVTLNEVIRDYIEINYYRLLKAESNSLPFNYDDGDYQYDIDNFTNSAVSIYEITEKLSGTNVVSPVRIINPLVSGSGIYSVSFQVTDDPDIPPGGKRYFIVSSGASLLTPDSCVLDTVSDLKDTTNQADIIVIGTPDTIDNSPGSPLDSLLDSRLANRGLTSKVVMFEDVCDEFNNGLFDPNAIRYFLDYAYNNWTSPKPSYLFIIGDGTFDYKNRYSLADFKSLVPTQIMFQVNSTLGYYSSDNWLACFIGTDQLPDIHLGRISTRSITESNGVFNKIKTYEDSPPSGTWKSHDLMISDEGKNGDPAETEHFEAVNQRQIDKYLSSPPHSYTKIYYAKPPYNGTDNALCKQDIKNAINSGTVITNYVGHGSFTRWSNDTIFTTDDVPTLTNGNMLPWLTASNCLTAGFHHAYWTTTTAIGEKFVNEDNKGSIATFAPAGLSYTFIGEEVINSIFDDIYGPHKERETAIITYNVRDLLYGNGSIVDLQGYTYLGDPVLDLVIPRPEPPTNPDAVGGNQKVDLTWTRSSDDPYPSPGFGYNVYRTTDLTKEYTKVNSSLIYGTSYTDTSVTNMTTYYYAITAVDAEGFESAYSNFNTDCAIDGPDCVKATPENPNPPANPTGFDAVDPETGGKLNLSWNANSETDLKGYTVYWGTKSRFAPDFPGYYENSKYVGKVTSYVLTGLQNDVVYYLCVTASNTSNKESGYSNEDSEKPDYVPGIKPPKAITDLMVKRSTVNQNDLELTWSKPTQDIYDDPETIKEYRIYRNTVPNFVPSDSNRIATITDPNTTKYTDPGAYSSASNYYYLVQSIDADGNASGVGREVPNGIDDMTVKKSQTTPGNIIFTWSAVTNDINGKKTIIDHYHLYGRGTKFKRSDIEKGLVPLIQDNITSTTLEITPADGDQYYSILAVDNRGNLSPY